MRGHVATLALVGLLASCSAPPAPTPPPSPSSKTAPAPPAATARGDIPPRFDLERGVAVVLSEGGERRFKVELAVKDVERQRGLMYRDALAEDEGMLFLFEAMSPLSFWMKNTWIPLDMIFIDDELTIVGIVENAEPMTLSSRSPGGHSRFVLEVKGGLSQQLGMKAGQKVRFEGVPAPLWQQVRSGGEAAGASPEPRQQVSTP